MSNDECSFPLFLDKTNEFKDKTITFDDAPVDTSEIISSFLQKQTIILTCYVQSTVKQFDFGKCPNELTLPRDPALKREKFGSNWLSRTY